MANERIKNHAKNSRVRLWEIAERLHIQDSAFSRKMRRELPESEKSRIIRIIDDLAAERGRTNVQ